MPVAFGLQFLNIILDHLTIRPMPVDFMILISVAEYLFLVDNHYIFHVPSDATGMVSGTFLEQLALKLFTSLQVTSRASVISSVDKIRLTVVMTCAMVSTLPPVSTTCLVLPNFCLHEDVSASELYGKLSGKSSHEIDRLISLKLWASPLVEAISSLEHSEEACRLAGEVIDDIPADVTVLAISADGSETSDIVIAGAIRFQSNIWLKTYQDVFVYSFEQLVHQSSAPATATDTDHVTGEMEGTLTRLRTMYTSLVERDETTQLNNERPHVMFERALVVISNKMVGLDGENKLSVSLLIMSTFRIITSITVIFIMTICLLF